VGDGVLVVLRPVVAVDECVLAPRALGIGMGLDVALVESWSWGDRLACALAILLLLVEVLERLTLPATLDDPSCCIVTSISSESWCCGSTGVGGTTWGVRTLRALLTLLAESLDFRGAAIVCD
jgi:hypothetical protein